MMMIKKRKKERKGEKRGTIKKEIKKEKENRNWKKIENYLQHLQSVLSLK